MGNTKTTPLCNRARVVSRGTTCLRPPRTRLREDLKPRWITVRETDRLPCPLVRDLAGDIGGVAGRGAPSSLTSVVSYVNADGGTPQVRRTVHRQRGCGQLRRARRRSVTQR
jgi:hypothetical protein